MDRSWASPDGLSRKWERRPWNVPTCADRAYDVGVRLRSDAAENRRRLLLATRDAVAAEGTGVSVRDIADRAGVSLSTVYRHFPDKQGLIDGLSVYRWATLHHLATRHAAANGSLPAIAHLLATFTRMVTVDDTFIRAVGITVGRTPYGILPVKARFDPLLAALWGMAVRRGEIRKGLDPRDALELAAMIRDPLRLDAQLDVVICGIATERGEEVLRARHPLPQVSVA
jgi:AcrR family transcriptional regulator